MLYIYYRFVKLEGGLSAMVCQCDIVVRPCLHYHVQCKLRANSSLSGVTEFCMSFRCVPVLFNRTKLVKRNVNLLKEKR